MGWADVGLTTASRGVVIQLLYECAHLCGDRPAERSAGRRVADVIGTGLAGSSLLLSAGKERLSVPPIAHPVAIL